MPLFGFRSGYVVLTSRVLAFLGTNEQQRKPKSVFVSTPLNGVLTAKSLCVLWSLVGFPTQWFPGRLDIISIYWVTENNHRSGSKSLLEE